MGGRRGDRKFPLHCLAITTLNSNSNTLIVMSALPPLTVLSASHKHDFAPGPYTCELKSSRLRETEFYWLDKKFIQFFPNNGSSGASLF